jgi:hypothetical protein
MQSGKIRFQFNGRLSACQRIDYCYSGKEYEMLDIIQLQYKEMAEGEILQFQKAGNWIKRRKLI